MIISTGCTVLETKSLKPNAASDGGVVYYLPTRPMKIEVVRSPAATKPELDKANAAVKAASDTLDAAEKTLAAASKRRDATAASTAARSDADKAVEFAKADVVLAKAELDAAKKKQAESQADHLLTLNGRPPLVDAITVMLLPMVADTSQRYRANVKHLVTRTENIEIKTTPAGLLSTNNVKASEQSAQILISLAQSLSAAAAAGTIPGYSFGLSGWSHVPGSGSSSPHRDSLIKMNVPADTAIDCGNGMTRRALDAPAPFRFEYVFNPTVESVTQTIAKNGQLSTEQLNPWAYLESALCALGADYRFEWQPLNTRVAAISPPELDNDSESWSGLLYRRALPYRMNLYRGERQVTPSDLQTVWKSFAPIKTLQFELPNESPPELLDINGGSFSMRTFGSEFTDGMLVAHAEERPSEALQIVSIPYQVIKAAISIPAEIISLKVDFSSKEAALVDAQAKLIQSEKALAEASKPNSVEPEPQ